MDALVGRLHSSGTRERAARTMLKEHIREHQGYVAWSGGLDSTVVVHLAVAEDPNVPVVWFDSGLEFPETREYIHDTADDWGVNLHIITPHTPVLEMLAGSGSFHHHASATTSSKGGGNLHHLLLQEPSQRAHRLFGAGEATGVRAEESGGRRALLAPRQGLYTRSDGAEVCCPVWGWQQQHIRGYLHTHGIPENPVYQRLRDLGAPPWAQRVGLLVDGNAAEYGRYTWLRLGWPELWADLVEALPRLGEWR